MVYHIDVVEFPVQEQTPDFKTRTGNLCQEKVNDVSELFAFPDVFHTQGVAFVPENDVDGGIDKKPCRTFFGFGPSGVAIIDFLAIERFLIEVRLKAEMYQT